VSYVILALIVAAGAFACWWFVYRWQQ